jgi:hypothetical protein
MLLVLFASGLSAVAWTTNDGQLSPSAKADEVRRCMSRIRCAVLRGFPARPLCSQRSHWTIWLLLVALQSLTAKQPNCRVSIRHTSAPYCHLDANFYGSVLWLILPRDVGGRTTESSRPCEIHPQAAIFGDGYMSFI